MTNETHAYCKNCNNDELILDGECLGCGSPLRPATLVQPARDRSGASHREAIAIEHRGVAARDSEVQALRSSLLPDGFLSREEVVPWLEERAKGGPLTSDLIACAGPDHRAVQWMFASEQLQPLARLCNRLCRQFGWSEVEATVWLLTDAILPVHGVSIQTTVTRRLRRFERNSAFDMTLDVKARDPLGGDAKLLAEAASRVRREAGAGRRPATKNELNDRALRAFIEEWPGPVGEKAHREWARRVRDSGVGLTYRTRQSWHAAVKRVAPERVAASS